LRNRLMANSHAPNSRLTRSGSRAPPASDPTTRREGAPRRPERPLMASGVGTDRPCRLSPENSAPTAKTLPSMASGPCSARVPRGAPGTPAECMWACGR
jgi:hypothetical protein